MGSHVLDTQARRTGRDLDDNVVRDAVGAQQVLGLALVLTIVGSSQVMDGQGAISGNLQQHF